jgi:hypothetical protein
MKSHLMLEAEKAFEKVFSSIMTQRAGHLPQYSLLSPIMR